MQVLSDTGSSHEMPYKESCQGLTWQSLDTRKKVQTVFSQNGACLVGKMIPHPVGVFCTHLGPPNGHFSKNIFL